MQPIWLGVIFTAVGFIAADIDIGPYYGSWFYLLTAIITLTIIYKKLKWINLLIYLCANALLLTIVIKEIWPCSLFLILIIAIYFVKLLISYINKSKTYP